MSPQLTRHSLPPGITAATRHLYKSPQVQFRQLPLRSDFLKFTPFKDDSISIAEAINTLGEHLQRTREPLRKEALHAMFASLSGVQALSLYVLELGMPKMFYQVGTPTLLFDAVPESGFLVRSNHIFTFSKLASHVLHFRSSEPAVKDIVSLPLVCQDTVRGFLVAEGINGVRMTFNSSENQLLLIEFLQQAVRLLSLVAKSWFDTDVTNLLKRAAFDEELVPSITQWLTDHRSKAHFAIFMLDLDNFKTVNDRHGHSAGDDVMREIARLLLQHTRKDPTIMGAIKGYPDLVFRWGGDEFILVLPNLVGTAAVETAFRLREAIKLTFEGITISASIGILDSNALKELVSCDASVHVVAETLELVDEALYLAKNDFKLPEAERKGDGVAMINSSGVPVLSNPPA